VNMNHRQKVDRLVEELGRQGISSHAAAPPLFRLLWMLGLDIPPPFFLEFRKLALVMGTFFAVLEGPLWGILMWLSLWQGEIPALIAVALTVFEAVLAGVAFGLVMARYLRRKSAQSGLPSWEDYPETQ
jgi:hypothetical protein